MSSLAIALWTRVQQWWTHGIGDVELPLNPMNGDVEPNAEPQAQPQPESVISRNKSIRFKVMLMGALIFLWLLAFYNNVSSLQGVYDKDVKRGIVFGYLGWLTFLCVPSCFADTDGLWFVFDVPLLVALLLISLVTFLYKVSYDHHDMSALAFAAAVLLNSFALFQFHAILVYIETATTDLLCRYAGRLYHDVPHAVNDITRQALEALMQRLYGSAWLKAMNVLAHLVVVYAIYQFFLIRAYNDITHAESGRFASAYVLFIEVASLVVLLLLTAKLSRFNKVVCAAQERFQIAAPVTIKICQRFMFGEDILLAIVIPTMLDLATTLTLLYFFR